MIIFGTRTSAYQPNTEEVCDCSHCGTKAGVYVRFATRYFHVFWIPVLPIGKTGISECTHCKQALYPHEMPPATRAAYNAARSKTRTKPKFFAGLILAGLFVAAAATTGFISHRQNTSYVRSPKAGDIYEVEDEEGFTLYKVAALETDSVTVLPHEYYVERWSKLRTMKRTYPNDYAADESFKIARKELETMLAERVIRNVHRK